MPERLTDARIAQFRPSSSKQSDFYFDRQVSGLAIRVYPSGRRVFCFDWRQNGRQHRVTIGLFPIWTIGKARARAKRLRLQADLGEMVDPDRGVRVTELVGRWREVVAVTRRPSTARNYEQMIRRHIVPAFGRSKPRAITRNDVEHWHGRLAQETPMSANRALAVLSAFMNWLERDNKIDRNPCKGVRRRPERQRQVLLDESEIAAAHAARSTPTPRAAAPPWRSGWPWRPAAELAKP